MTYSFIYLFFVITISFWNIYKINNKKNFLLKLRNKVNIEQEQDLYKVVQKGGDIPLFGLKKYLAEKSKGKIYYLKKNNHIFSFKYIFIELRSWLYNKLFI
jgi:hypothetical protein